VTSFSVLGEQRITSVIGNPSLGHKLLIDIKAQTGCPSRNLSNSMTRSRIRPSVINWCGERPANASSGEDSHSFFNADCEPQGNFLLDVVLEAVPM
jgi:hypothetical protein